MFPSVFRFDKRIIRGNMYTHRDRLSSVNATLQVTVQHVSLALSRFVTLCISLVYRRLYLHSVNSETVETKVTQQSIQRFSLTSQINAQLLVSL